MQLRSNEGNGQQLWRGIRFPYWYLCSIYCFQIKDKTKQNTKPFNKVFNELSKTWDKR